MPTKLTQEQFIQRSKEKHNNRYDYSLVEYISMHKKVKIICSSHGKFEQTPYAHLHKGQGCKKCGLLFRSEGRTRTTDEFIEEAKEIHGNRYDYSKAVYTLAKEKLEIICKEHGSFWQSPNIHILLKSNCPCCKEDDKFLTQNEFIERAINVHGDKYNYSLSRYENCITPITIICSTHGEFSQKPAVHLAGANCPACVGHQRLSTELFIKKSNIKHNHRYTYENVNFTNSSSVVEITCPVHGSFWQRATAHLHDGTGCPKCSKMISNIETEWLNLLNLPDDPQHRQVHIRVNNRKIKVDGFDSTTNTVYEFLGDFWHGNPKKFNLADINVVAKVSFQRLYDRTFKRINLLKEAGYTVVYIWESDFKELTKQYSLTDKYLVRPTGITQ